MADKKKRLLCFRTEAEKFVQQFPVVTMRAFNPEQETVTALINLLTKVAKAENKACTMTARGYKTIGFEEADVRQSNIVKALRARWPEKGKV